MVDEIELLRRLKDVAPVRAEAFEEARTRLRETIGTGRESGAPPRPARHRAGGPGPSGARPASGSPRPRRR